MDLKKHKDLTLKYLLGMTVADVDIFLLMDESQEKDNDKEYFTREEIRAQLGKTLSNVVNGLESMGIDTDEPIRKKNDFFLK